MQNHTIPELYYRGQPLDTSSQAFGEMRSSRDAIGDFDELRRRVDEDGYLLLSGLLDRDQVMSARREVLSRVDTMGLLDAGSPLMDGIVRDDVTIDFENERQFHRLAIDNSPLDNLLYSGAMMEYFAAFLGGAVRHYDRTWLRVKGNRDTTTTFPHYDIVYMGRGTTRVFTAWTSLGDTPLEMGGLMIAENSHRLEEVKNTYGKMDVDTYCTNSDEAADIESGKKLWADMVDLTFTHIFSVILL